MSGRLHEETVRAVQRWQQGLAGPGGSSGALAAIARDAANLRASALQAGATFLAERLETVSRLASTAPHALPAALHAFLDLLSRDPRLAALGGASSEDGSELGPPPLLDASVVEPSLILAAPVGGAAGEGAPFEENAADQTMIDSTMASWGLRGEQEAPVLPASPRADVAHRPPPVEARDPRPVPPARDDSQPPPLAPPAMVQGTFFGFRAFRGPRAGLEPAAPARPAAPGPAVPQGGVLGLKRPRPFASAPGAPARRDPAPPRPLANRIARSESPPRRPTEAPGSPRRHGGVPTWFYFVGGAVVVLALATVAVIVAASGDKPKDVSRSEAPRPDGAAAIAAKEEKGAGSAEAADAVTARIHVQGEETPQLRALLDLQGQLASSCRNDPSRCGRGWTPLARDALSPVDKAALAIRPSPTGPLPPWLHNLKVPSDFPIHDEPAIRNLFDFSTKNIAGRQNFQAKLFQCSAYADIFESTLVKYGAPRWLSAVVYQESGCNPLATSPVGARGLWQFMPESARAYGLRVVDGEIDERLNPIKSTDAAMHFLTDMQRNLGSWDLVLAAYNMGPYAVLARITQIGQKVGFWDLEHAGLLPEETAGYVPAIEAYAILLENLGRLQFNPYGKRLESTAEVIVKPGLRLSLLARAASTTTAHIRDLNPEFLRDVVPEDVRAARVPDTEVHRAQAFLDAWSPSDSRDTCVPPDFDWGAQQFETSRYAKGCKPSAEP